MGGCGCGGKSEKPTSGWALIPEIQLAETPLLPPPGPATPAPARAPSMRHHHWPWWAWVIVAVLALGWLRRAS